MARVLQGLPKLAEWAGFKGYQSSAPKETQGNFMAVGSENVMLTGTGKTQAFKGMLERSESDGGIVMMNVAERENAYASIGQASDITGYGNAFNVYSCLFYIGKGLLRLAGESLSAYADATLHLLVKIGGSYLDADSGPWGAGLAQSSAPIIRAVSPPAGFTGKNNGVVSVVIWRIRSSTGAVSIHSEVSNVVAATNQSIAVTFPLPDANGQDYWGVGVTRNGEGVEGAHFEFIEIAESEVAGDTLSRSDIVTNAASLNITSATAGFTSEHIGWVVNLSGGSPVCVFSSYVTAVPAPNTLTLAAMPPTTSTGVNLALGSGVEGTERTNVIEWRDGDLIGREFAPFRDYPPPNGFYAGAVEDIVFVDGAYADSTDEVSDVTGTVGSAIAPSEPGRPESFAPDSVIFTNDIPTALIRGDGLYYRFGRNSCYLIRYLGGEKPLSVEIAWEGLGINHQHNACLGEGGRLYFWPNERGPMRMDPSGMPEGDFATDVADDLATLTDPVKRVLGWDGKLQVVAYCYELKIWPWFTALRAWGAPANLALDPEFAGTYVRSAVTENGILLLADELDNLYEYNAGSGSVMKVRTGWAISPGGMDNVSLIAAAVRADNVSDILIETFADGDEDEVVSSMEVMPTRTGYQRLPAVWPNVQDCESHAIQITMESTTENGDVGVESITTYGDVHSMLR